MIGVGDGGWGEGGVPPAAKRAPFGGGGMGSPRARGGGVRGRARMGMRWVGWRLRLAGRVARARSLGKHFADRHVGGHVVAAGVVVVFVLVCMSLLRIILRSRRRIRSHI